NIITSTDPKGNVYTYNYDALGNPTNVTGPEGYNASLSFNARGNLLSYTDARGNNSSAEYDILNRLKKITDPVNNNTQLNYDAAGNMVSYKNKNNETNWRSYDASNRLVKIKGPTGNEFNYTYDGMDNLLSVKDPLGFENKFSFDNRNRVISAFDPENNSTGYTYDNNGNVTSKRLPNGQTFFYTHDNLNRLILIKDQTGDIAKFSYDPNGNPTRFENGTGAIITATYDSLNRLKSETDALGNSITYAYDKNSNLIAVTDQEGKTSNFTYDNKDRLHTYTDNNAAVITLGYDAANNITSRKDQNNNTTTYLYDELNRRKRMTYPDGKYNEYNYDSKGNIISVRLTDATAILYQYDTLKRLIRRTLPGGEQYNFTYDKLNRVISATNNNGTVNVSYDGLNRIISESFDGRTVNYTYSISGRTKSTVYPDGSVVKKEFDTRGRLVKIFKDNIPVVEYAYNNANQLTAKSFANNVSSLLQYDYANRLSNLNTSSGTIQNSNFTYNKTYNKTAVNRLNDPTGSETFNYDNGYRLTNYKKGPPGSPVVQNTYTYDAVGNRTAANLGGAAKTYSINNLNQLTAVNGTVFTFDNRGNLAYDGSSYKTYDAENRLLKDSASPLRVIAYSYDAFGRRITKNINGSILKYTYSGASQIEERDGANTLRNKTVFNDFLSPVINEKNGQTFYYHANESGSVEAITNSNGRLIEKYSYDAYGKMSRFDSLNNPLSSSIAGNRFGFTGQEYDSASGSYRFFFRNYSPETGVFNQRDLIEYEDGMGMYQYVGNNPANGIDIWGLAASDDCIEGEKGIDLRNTWILPLPFDEMARKVGDIQHSQTKSEKIHNQVELFDQVGEAGIKMVVANVVSQLANGKYVLQNVFSVLGQGASQIAAGGPVGAVSAGATTTVAAGVAIGLPVGFYGLHVYKEGMEIDNNISNTEVYNYMLTHGKEGEGYERYLKLKHLEEMTRERDRLNKNPCPPQGGTRKKYRLFWDPKTKMWVLRPIDPNLIIGPDGEPGKKWVPLPDRMPYTVLFENDSSATAPAKFVRISTTIHPKHDPATFELGSVGFNNQSFDIPAGTASYYTRLDCRDSLNLFVDLTAGYDQITHQAFWEFQSIDPLTLLPTEDPLAGFVMLQDSLNPLYGNGFVNYSIKPAASAHTLDTVTAQASITFDQNAAIATNVHSNTIDAVAPMSSITALIPFTPDTEVPLHYTGADDNNGSGLRSYSIFVSDNSGTPQLYVQDFTKADTVFRGLANHTYRFYAAAKDTAGNIETLRPLDSIRITNGEFVICPNGNVNFDSKMTGSSFQWQVDNGTGYTNIVNGGIYSGATTPVLQIITAPSTMYGFKYRCLANGTTYSLQFVLKFGMTWEGNTSESWENPANWSCGSLPDQNTDVTIDAAKTNYPKVNSNVIIRTLRLNNGSTGTVNTGYNFTILK
ncbi:MAG: hypothetical protein H7Y86_10705, partial [Rhizobacter sp.]|nr:hypothetical protein [Ferruginibacter sp.]